MTIKRTIRLTEQTATKLTRIAEEENCSENAVIENALKYYSDYLYMQEKATVIPQEIVKTLQASTALMEQRINNRTNQVLSALAIETCTLMQVIANSLEVKPDAVQKYRRGALDYLKANQRVFRLDEVVD